MNKKKRWLGALSCMVAIGILAGCNQDDKVSAEPKKKDVSVEVADVAYGSLSDSNRLSGQIVPETEVNVVAKTSGELKKILVEKGDVVKKGDVLAQLDDSAERNAMKQQQTALKQAQAGLRSAQNGKVRAQESYAQSQVSIKQAEAALANARQSQTDNLDNLEFQISNAKMAWEQATQNLDRMKLLLEDGLISQQNYEDAVNAEKSAKNAFDQVQLNKTQAGNTVSLQSLEASIEQARAGANLAQSSIKDAEIGIQQAQASVESAQLAVDAASDRLSDKVIVATASGEITELNGEVGGMASMQQPFATIVSINTVKVSVNILASQLSSFQVGSAVNVEVDGFSEIFTGTVTYVSAVSSGSGLFTLEAEVDNKNQVIKPGMVATIIVDEILEDDSLLVPTASIIQKEGKSVVFIVADEKVTQQEVEVIRYGTDVTAIDGNVKEKEQVVVKGQNLLHDGDAVKIVEEE